MINTSTYNQTITENTFKTEQAMQLPDFFNPSDSLINTILNYSKNLEIKTSQFINEIVLIKS